MKNLRKVILMFAMTIATAAMAQTAYKGQFYINSERFTRQGDLLRVQLRVSYNDDVLNSGDVLNFTPVLKSGTKMKTLSSVVVNGKERGKYENRKAHYAKRVRRNVAVITADKRNGTRYFLYDSTIPYADWMDGASLYIESEEHGWGRKPHVYEDRVFQNIKIAKAAATNTADTKKTIGSTVKGTAAKTAWVQFLDPSEASTERFSVSGTIALDDNRHIGDMKESKFNSAVFEEIDKTLAEQLQQPGTTVDQLHVIGYGAPIGNYKTNEERGAQRALNLKRYLMNNKVLGADGLSVTWIPEDWDSIEAYVDRSDMKLKAAVLDVINTIPVVNGREDEIRRLGDGAPYSFMQEYIFPKVRRIQYTATLLRKGSSGDGTLNGDSHAVTLMSMYASAKNFAVGSREYNDITDLTARLFPDNAEAAINAAGVALLRGNLPLADQYLKPWQTDSRAYNNLGVLHMLRGEYDKAEVYLKMAQAAGAKQATKALEYLRNVNAK